MKILTLSESTNDFMVYFDNFRVDLHFVLLLNGKIISYASRKLKVHKKNHLIYDLELSWM